MWLAETKLFEVGITYISFQFANSLQKLHVKPEYKNTTFNEPGPF